MSTHDTEQAVERLIDALGGLFESHRQVDWGARIESVARNANGQVLSATARVQGKSGIAICVSANQTDLYPGAIVAVENLGNVGAPVWSMRAGVAAGAALPGVWQGGEEYSVGATTVSEGDFLFGSADINGQNLFYDDSAKKLQVRKGSTVVMEFDTNGALGFFGTRTATQATAYATPTDLPSCITALTSLRSALIAYGLLAETFE
jgi:hypothetical protein